MNRRIETYLPLVLLASALAAGCGKPADGMTSDGGGRPPVAVETAKAATSEVEQAVDVVGTLTTQSDFGRILQVRT